MPPRSAPLPGPLPVTKYVMFGACGSCGGAGGCCCALTPDATPSASAATINAFGLLISVVSLGILLQSMNSRLLIPLKHNNKYRIGLFRSRGRAFCGHIGKSAKVHFAPEIGH